MVYQFVLFADVTDSIFATKVIGPYKCANMLRANGYSCLVIDHLHSYSFNELDQLLVPVIGPETLAVGFSTTFFQNVDVPPNSHGGIDFEDMTLASFLPQGHQFEELLLQRIKELNPNSKIILGGANAFAYNQRRTIDYVLIGFTEVSFPNLADHLSKGTKLDNAIKNLWGVTVIDDRDARGHDFRSTSVSWQDIDVVNSRVLPIEVSRGCIFKCKFCAFPMNGKKNLDFIKDTELIRKELQEAYDQFGIDTFNIVDDTFNDNEYKINEFLSAVKQLTFQPKFWAYVRLDLIRTTEQIEKLYDIGIRSYYFGIETLNKKTGSIIGKGWDPQRQIEVVQEMRQRYGDLIAMHGSFIIGLPEESIDSVRNTYNLIMDGTLPLQSFDFRALFIEKLDTVTWSSEIGREYNKFGYRDSGIKLDRYIDWINNDMDRYQAMELADEFKDTSRYTQKFRLSGQSIWSLLNYNMPLDYLMTLDLSKLNWYALSMQKNKHIKQYKEKLRQLLNIHD